MLFHRNPLAWLQSYPQNLILFLGLSVAIHGILLVGYGHFSKLENWLNGLQPHPTKPSFIPIDYVEIPPNAKSSTPPPSTPYKASFNSVAGGPARPDRPVSAIASSTSASQRPQPSQAIPPRPSTSQSSTASAPPASAKTEPLESTTNTETRNTELPSLPGLGLARHSLASPPAVSPPTGQASQSRPTSITRPLRSQPRTSSTSFGADQLATQPVGIGNGGLLNNQFNANRATDNPPGINAQADVLGPYLDGMKLAVKQQWMRSPMFASRRTVIAFVINKGGDISDLQVIQPSGSATMDQEAIDAIRRAAPFAPLPADYPENMVMIHFGFTITISGDLRPDS
jgi:TonB family protein